MGAAIAYYTAFSLAPLLVIVIAVAGLIFGRDAASGALFQQFSGLIGADGAKALETMIASASDVGDSIWAVVIGVGLLLFSATTVFGEIQGSLNVIWEPPESDRPAVSAWVRARLASLGVVLSLGFLFLVLMIVGTAVDALSAWLEAIAPGLGVLAVLINTLVSVSITFLLFALIYRLLPDMEIPWREVWFGAGISTLLFHVGRWAIGAYIANTELASTFGAASALVVILVWVYYSAQIFLFGACITKVVSERRRPQAHSAASPAQRSPSAGQRGNEAHGLRKGANAGQSHAREAGEPAPLADTMAAVKVMAFLSVALGVMRAVARIGDRTEAMARRR